MDERLELLVQDYQAGRYTRRQFAREALRFGVAVSGLPALLELAGGHVSPRAGRLAEAATTTRGLPENSRAITTFCRLPPERIRTCAAGPGAAIR